MPQRREHAWNPMSSRRVLRVNLNKIMFLVSLGPNSRWAAWRGRCGKEVTDLTGSEWPGNSTRSLLACVLSWLFVLLWIPVWTRAWPGHYAMHKLLVVDRPTVFKTASAVEQQDNSTSSSSFTFIPIVGNNCYRKYEADIYYCNH